MDELKFKEHYYKLANEQTMETLPSFIKEVIGAGNSDYGKVCRAIAASALATMHALARQEGITGFQAGCILWDIIVDWQYKHNKTGLKLVDYDNMLYAQYESSFDKHISKGVFERLQKEAQKLVDEKKTEREKYVKDLKQYGIDLAAFIKKHPDYTNNPKQYEHLDGGTGSEWAAYHKKVDSGFEFAPRKPFYHEGQIEHWMSIASGQVPFGYTISED